MGGGMKWSSYFQTETTDFPLVDDKYKIQSPSCCYFLCLTLPGLVALHLVSAPSLLCPVIGSIPTKFPPRSTSYFCSVLDCTVGDEGVIGDLSSESISAHFQGLHAIVLLAATTWSGQIWISG